LLDDPSLTVRHWSGKNPTRLVIDKELKLPMHLKLFDETVPTIVFNNTKTQEGKLAYQKLSPGSDYLQQLLERLYEQNILSVLVEGGTKTLQSFIDKGLWDEARIITNNERYIDDGKQAPTLRNCRQHDSEEILTDTIRYYQHI
jgi:diaminohydroxyphosphoribosylaminopyrimidine deaminase / 5-amino-6-(5-phosphoribosylamino)uracil reductase